MLKNTRAQSTLEYAVLIGLIAAGLVTTQVVLKRHYQGKLRQSAEDMGEQFSPGYTTYNYTTTSTTASNEKTEKGVTTTNLLNSTSDRTGSERVEGNDSEYWPK